MRSFFDYDIYMQKYSPAGVPQWTADGLRISGAYGDEDLKKIIAFGDTLLVFWQGGDWSDQNQYYRLLDADGQLLSDSLVLCDTLNNQLNPVFAQDHYSVVVVWEDRRDFDGDLYHQVIDRYGQKQVEPQGRPVCTALNDQTRADVCVHRSAEGLDYHIVWQDFRNGNDFNIYGRSYHNLVAGDEFTVTDAGLNQLNPRLAWNPQASPQPLIVFEDYQPEVLFSNIMMRTSESLLIPVCEATNKQLRPQMMIVPPKPDGSTTAWVIWEDLRSSGKTELTNLYARAFEFSGTAIGPQPQTLPQRITLEAFPNPFNPQLQLNITVTQPGEVAIRFYDLLGRQVSQYHTHAVHGGRITYRWEAQDAAGRRLPSGVYLCQVSTPDGVFYKRITYLR